MTDLHNSKNYPGSKGAQGAWQKIISQIPRCNCFIEVMAGSGFISRQLKANCSIVINDLERSVLERIQAPAGAIKENLHYKDLVTKYAAPGAVFYFDPPYLIETRRDKKPIYKIEWDDQDHVNFLNFIILVNSDCMISHYPCLLYDTILKGWRKITYQTATRGGPREENLYLNFPQPVLLSDYRFVGKNFTDRQRIQRKVGRLVKRLAREDPADRAAIFSSMLDHFNYVVPRP